MIRTTTTGFLLFGFSWQTLFFRRSGARMRDDIEVMRPDQRRVAYWCPMCRGMFVSSLPAMASG